MRGLGLALLGGIGLAAAQGAPQWVQFRPGMTSRGWASAGTMPDGLPVHICTAPYAGGVHPGLTGAWTEHCHLGFGGREVQATMFQVLTGQIRWRRVTFDLVPEGAIEAGREADGSPLYVCRANAQGAVLAGKYRPGLGGCNVGDQGVEVTLRPVEVLVR